MSAHLASRDLAKTHITFGVFSVRRVFGMAGSALRGPCPNP